LKTDHAPAASHFEIGGINPEIGPFTFERPVEKRLYALVDFRTQPGNLALGDAGQTHRFD
jgi:hypothetical protein